MPFPCCSPAQAHDGRYGRISASTYLNYDSASNPTTRTSAPSGVARGIGFDTLTLNSQGTWQASDAHTVTGGFAHKNEQLEDGATSAVNVHNAANDAFVSMERYQLSAFAEDEWRLREGLNYDHSRGTSLWARAAHTGKFISTDLTTGAATSRSYTLVDMGIVHRLKRNLALKFGIYNLADKDIANSSNGYVDGRRYATAVNYAF